MSIRRAAAARAVSADEAAGLVRSGMWLDYGQVLSAPDVFDKALGARIHELHDLKFRGCLTLRPRAIQEADPEGRRVHMFNWHFSGYDRKKSDNGQCGYIPVNLGEIADYYRRFIEPPDIVVLKTAPIDAQGNFNFGPSNLWTRAVVDMAKTVIVETCSSVPYSLGVDNAVHVGEVDYIVDGGDAPLPELPAAALTEVERAVSRLVANEIEDGCCLQIGVGGMPNAVCSLLKDSGVRNLGIHTEMLVDGIIDLHNAGMIDGSAKQLDPGKIVYSFALGSKYLYDAIHQNADFVCYPTDYTNMPHIIMRNDKVVSINNTTQMDLQGQAASESDGHRHISGTGGQLQFVRGGYASKGGKSIICLSSTYSKRGAPHSRIVFDLTPGNVVTTPRSDMMYVVTEYGMVNLKGKSLAQRAKLMISIAHPDFRDELERQAYEHKIIPKGFTI